MPNFDPNLAKAELDGIAITVTHHLRQIQIARDKRTALYFLDKLAKLERLTRKTVQETRK